MKINITQPAGRSVDIIEELYTVWEDSVRTTHHFLTEGDIKNLRPVVIEGLKEIPVLAVATSNGREIGFIGIANKKIEMLFVAPKHIGRGVGHSLLKWAIETQDVCYIDVNEQNSKTAAIYRHWGFEVYHRSEFDEQGNPFPILQMKLSLS